MTSIKIQYSAQIVLKKVCSYWWDEVGSKYLAVLIPVIIFVFFRMTDDRFTWLEWILSFGIILYTTLMIILYIQYINQSFKRVHLLNVPEATLELGEEQFCLISDAGIQDVNWCSISDIWYSEELWFLEFSRHKIMPLPVVDLDVDSKSFIISKVEANNSEKSYRYSQEPNIYRTGQSWKLRLMHLCGYLGGLFIFGPWFIDSMPTQWAKASNSVGFIFALGSLVFLYTIRCPACLSHWELAVAKSMLGMQGSKGVLSRNKCPFCGVSDFESNKKC